MPTEGFEQRCDNCRFYSPHDEESIVGACRRYPPRLLKMDGRDYQYDSLFPDTNRKSWCGEFIEHDGTLITGR